MSSPPIPMLPGPRLPGRPPAVPPSGDLMDNLVRLLDEPAAGETPTGSYALAVLGVPDGQRVTLRRPGTTRPLSTDATGGYARFEDVPAPSTVELQLEAPFAGSGRESLGDGVEPYRTRYARLVPPHSGTEVAVSWELLPTTRPAPVQTVSLVRVGETPPSPVRDPAPGPVTTNLGTIEVEGMPPFGGVVLGDRRVEHGEGGARWSDATETVYVVPSAAGRQRVTVLPPAAATGDAARRRSAEVTVQPGRATRIRYGAMEAEPLPPTRGTLRIASMPLGSTLYLGDRAVVTGLSADSVTPESRWQDGTPNSGHYLLDAPAGSQVVRIAHPDGRSQTFPVTVVAGQTQLLWFNPPPAPVALSLVLSGVPNGSRVVLTGPDGAAREVARTDGSDVRLPMTAGAARLVIDAPTGERRVWSGNANGSGVLSLRYADLTVERPPQVNTDAPRGIGVTGLRSGTQVRAVWRSGQATVTAGEGGQLLIVPPEGVRDVLLEIVGEELAPAPEGGAQVPGIASRRRWRRKVTLDSPRIDVAFESFTRLQGPTDAQPNTAELLLTGVEVSRPAVEALVVAPLALQNRVFRAVEPDAIVLDLLEGRAVVDVGRGAAGLTLAEMGASAEGRDAPARPLPGGGVAAVPAVRRAVANAGSSQPVEGPRAAGSAPNPWSAVDPGLFIPLGLSASVAWSNMMPLGVEAAAQRPLHVELNTAPPPTLPTPSGPGLGTVALALAAAAGLGWAAWKTWGGPRRNPSGGCGEDCPCAACRRARGR